MGKRRTPARGQASSNSGEDLRTGLSPECIALALVDNLFYDQGKLPEFATKVDWYLALADTAHPDALLAAQARS